MFASRTTRRSPRPWHRQPSNSSLRPSQSSLVRPTTHTHTHTHTRTHAHTHTTSRRRDCHSAARPSPFSWCFNMDGEGMSVKWQSRRRIPTTSKLSAAPLPGAHPPTQPPPDPKSKPLPHLCLRLPPLPPAPPCRRAHRANDGRGQAGLQRLRGVPAVGCEGRGLGERTLPQEPGLLNRLLITHCRALWRRQ